MAEESRARGGTPSSGSARLRLRDSGSRGMGAAGSGAAQSRATAQVGADTPGYGVAAPRALIPYGRRGWALSWGCRSPQRSTVLGTVNANPGVPQWGRAAPP